MSEIERALVLGGGGVAGIAWTTGVLAGLATNGVDVAATARKIVGTSAGATVAAQVTSDLTLPELLERQINPALHTPELASGVAMDELWTTLQQIYESSRDATERLRGFGAMALAADTVPEPERRRVIEARLPSRTWPERDLVIVAVAALTGELTLFGPGSGVDLVDAVAASCAVPGVWPPVTIDGVRYIDGGVRSIANADLAAGHDRVLVIAPMPEPLPGFEATGGAVEVVEPDEASAAAFGLDPLAPETRVPCAKAGYAQGVAVSERVAAMWR
ncbi:patatin-like phospholipase family protein [Nonomuraea rhizosphaerae]|uniref:patatin-like phospholipase family protein n=1 Tax=Nonomuraea rhizosphaerae TaxID=2665663 RepID=UPI001FE9A8F2|nr:patatin-like phospholipase family protein [Nonomuraea rhizosphaerae]